MFADYRQVVKDLRCAVEYPAGLLMTFECCRHRGLIPASGISTGGVISDKLLR